MIYSMAGAFRSRDVGRERYRQQARGAVQDVPGMRATTASAKPRLSDEERIDWLRLIRSENVGPRGIMAQTPPTQFYCAVAGAGDDPPAREFHQFRDLPS
jgi:hypothetical protein